MMFLVSFQCPSQGSSARDKENSDLNFAFDYREQGDTSSEENMDEYATVADNSEESDEDKDTSQTAGAIGGKLLCFCGLFILHMRIPAKDLLFAFFSVSFSWNLIEIALDLN